VQINKGDRVKIVNGRGVWAEGIVFTAANNEWDVTKAPNWYIELDMDKGTAGRGYGYWKQSYEGGTVELL